MTTPEPEPTAPDASVPDAPNPTPEGATPDTPEAPAAEQSAAEQPAAGSSPVGKQPEGGDDRSLTTVVRNVFTAENTWLVTFLAIVLSLVVGSVLIVLSNTETMDKASYFFSDPSDFLSSAWDNISSAYSSLFKGAIFDPATVSGTPEQFFGPITNTLEYATPLIFGGLGISVAFRAGMFNIGGQGQTIIGAIFTSYVAFEWTSLPGALHLIVAVLAGLVGGMQIGRAHV